MTGDSMKIFLFSLCLLLGGMLTLQYWLLDYYPVNMVPLPPPYPQPVEPSTPRPEIRIPFDSSLFDNSIRPLRRNPFRRVRNVA
jgi:hypothetical protein